METLTLCRPPLYRIPLSQRIRCPKPPMYVPGPLCSEPLMC
jgi:hypothetical protein